MQTDPQSGITPEKAAQDGAAQSAAAAQAEIVDPLHGGFPPGLEGRILFWIAVAFSAFQIATAAHA